MKPHTTSRVLLCTLFLVPLALADNFFEPGSILYKRTDGLIARDGSDDFTGALPDNTDEAEPFGVPDDPGTSLISQLNVNTESIAPYYGINLALDDFDLAFVFYFYDADGQFSFTENFDDRVRLTVTPIAGPTDTTATGAPATHTDLGWNVRTFADFDFGAAGWHCAEILLTEDGGGAQSPAGLGFGYSNAASTFNEADYALIGGGAVFDTDGNGDRWGAVLCAFESSPDTDGDGLPDDYETRHFPGDLNQLGPGDLDGDGVSDLDEFNDRTDPTQADRDLDGLNDGEEKAAGTDPLDADTDGDGLLDGAETNTGTFVSPLDTGTDPLARDSDGDLAGDGLEVSEGTDPNDENDVSVLWTVRNGLSATALNSVQNVRDLFAAGPVEETITKEEHINFGENVNGPFQPQPPFPLLGTKGTDVNDYAILATAPLAIQESGFYTFGFNSDDGGGLWIDGLPVVVFDANRGSATSLGGIYLVAGQHEIEFLYWERGGGAQVQLFRHNEIGDFTTAPSDNATILANYSLVSASVVDASDTDADGIPDVVEESFFPGDLTRLGTGDFDGDGINDRDEIENGTLPTEADTDGDGLEDGEEATTGTDPRIADTDRDGLSDGDELIVHGTDPLDPDSDDDGADDGVEVGAGTDPLNAGSIPDLWVVRNATSSVELNTIQNVRDLFEFGTNILAETTTIERVINFRENAAGPFQPQKSFPVIGTQGTDTNDFAILATGPLFIEEAGIHTFGFSSDDGGGFWIDGAPVVIVDLNRGTATSLGAIHLSEGEHEMEFIYWERGGGAQVQLFRHNEIGDFTLAGTGDATILANYSLLAAVPGTPVDTLRLDVQLVGGQLQFTWNSAGGELYNLRSETDPSTSDPADWPIFGAHRDIEATPPMNTLTVPLPPEDTRLFVIEVFPAPPETIFFEDFEAGLGAWTVGSDGAAGTMWEVGPPTSGPGTAFSGSNVAATNLDGNYDLNAQVWLRSPPIDLTTAGAATLRYQEWRDIEQDFDFGTINVLNAADGSLLAVVNSTIEGFTFDWEEAVEPLPNAALGNTIELEFRFTSEVLQNFAGWYIDDITVTVP